MGVFNYVNYNDTCKACGTEMIVENFQTSICERPLRMRPIEVWEAHEFSGFCPKCKHHHHYKVDAEVEVKVDIKRLDIELIKHESLADVRKRIGLT